MISSPVSISVSLDTVISGTGDLAVSLMVPRKSPPIKEPFDSLDGAGLSSFADGSALKVEPRTKPFVPNGASVLAPKGDSVLTWLPKGDSVLF